MGRTKSEANTKRAKNGGTEVEESREAGKSIEKEGKAIVYLCFSHVDNSGKSVRGVDDLEEISVVNYY